MAHSEPRGSQRIGFLLIPNFALMSFASATEPLRAANLISGVDLYEVVALSTDGRPVTSSSGTAFECQPLEKTGGTCNTVFVVAGGGPRDWALSEADFGRLRRLPRLGIRVGGISSGAYVLAAAGLLDNRDFTIHWEHAPVLREAFGHLAPRHARYVIDGDRITCAGGIAPLDMMHALIGERMGSHFARRVSDWYLHTAVAEPEAPQRGSSAERFGTHHPVLLAVLEKMEASIEQPLGRAAMARFAGTSVRHLDRLFAAHMEEGFLDTYRRIRLTHARRLVEQSPLSISEVAFASGFSSAGHFSNAFKILFGTTPAALRRNVHRVQDTLSGQTEDRRRKKHDERR
ncbi:AraC family transcriptional regulator with amidase-like domain [Ciceribacter lividus]|uniref:AraC family transcriptional regulator with amidase-like domain n=1 Tax=Ciceribacter lividus TaxID=1197950 RepID=A0A6I7HM20_9HYPH|nr:GlxA family transcriptional regulator [Ciceribacter lividus]RCW22694.1 AraC family transcriptional regulator with amidase-like domain [Ciceribacter lividus]